MNTKRFRRLIWDYYHKHGRDLPWRSPPLKLRKDKSLDPYRIFVSEVMLQQTQVSRVLEKYPKFIKVFPNIRALARAPLREVLRVWHGMGYNRRALYLKRAAEIIVRDHGGNIPNNPAVLVTLPGVGENTAGAIAAFAFNKPTIFIETNIRRVFIYHFFSKQNLRNLPSALFLKCTDIFLLKNSSCSRQSRSQGISKTTPRLGFAYQNKLISDAEILPLVAQTLDRKNPRKWYWALMDYGSALALTMAKGANPNRKSAHYKRQPKFEGSRRQLRGQILRYIGDHGPQKARVLTRALKKMPAAVRRALHELCKDDLITQQGNLFRVG